MNRLTAALVSALLAVPALAQTKGTQPRTGTTARTAPKNDGIAGTLKVTPDASASPAEESVRGLIAALQKKQAAALWDFLPTSYQRELNGLVQTLATKVDPRLYDQSLALLSRTSQLLTAKKQFILGTPTVKGMIAGREGDAGKVLDGVATLLDSIANSELKNHASLLTFDGRKFLDKTGRDLLSQLMQIAAMGGDDPMKILSAMKVKTVEQAGDRVLLSFSAPGKPPATEQYQLVEGKWLPSDMVEKWNQSIPDARRRIAALPDGGDKKQQAQVRMQLDMVNSMLKRFEDADTQAEFDEAVQALTGMRAAARPAPGGR
jgi:hypothetical protein